MVTTTLAADTSRKLCLLGKIAVGFDLASPGAENCGPNPDERLHAAPAIPGGFAGRSDRHAPRLREIRSRSPQLNTLLSRIGWMTKSVLSKHGVLPGRSVKRTVQCHCKRSRKGLAVTHPSSSAHHETRVCAVFYVKRSDFRSQRHSHLLTGKIHPVVRGPHR